ncbi:hypothetical protein GCM10020255_098300 [Rhodococcus baikonurensis]
MHGPATVRREVEPGVFGLEALQFEGNVLGGSIGRDVDDPLVVTDSARSSDKSDRPLEGRAELPRRCTTSSTISPSSPSSVTVTASYIRAPNRKT